MASVQCQTGHPAHWTCGACVGPASEELYAHAPAHFNERGELIPYAVVDGGRLAVAAPPGDVQGAIQATPSSPDTDVDLDFELAYPDEEPTLAPPPPPPPQSSSPPPASFSSSGPYSPLKPVKSQSPSAQLQRSSAPAPPPRIPLPRRTPRIPSTSHPPRPPLPKRSAPDPARRSMAGPIAIPSVPAVQTRPLEAVPPRGVPDAPSAHAYKVPAPPAVYPVSSVATPPMHPPAAPRRPPASPVYMPAPPPSLTAAPLQTVPEPCVTPGCAGMAPAAGRRCLACVRGSWVGRREARDTKGKGKETPREEPRVKIKLKLGAAKGQVKQASEEENGKGKGKEVQADVEMTDAPPVEENEKEADKAKEAADDLAPGSDLWDGVGWDSELSELTDTDGGESEMEVEEIPRPSFKIRIPARTPAASPVKPPPASVLPTPPASTSGTPEAPRLCTIARCRAPLPPHALYRWKCCSPCRKQYREYQRARLGRLAASNSAGDAPPPSTPARAGPSSAVLDERRAYAAQREWEREEKKRALDMLRLEPRREVVQWEVAPAVQLQRNVEQVQVVEGARACTGRGCGHIIPGVDEYSWSLCSGCRGRERRREQALVKDGKAPVVAKKAEQDDFPLAPEPRSGRCIYGDCGMLLPVSDSGVSSAECEQCARRKKQRRTPGRPPGSRNKPKPVAGSETAKANTKAFLERVPQSTTWAQRPEVPRKRKRISPYPPYQCYNDLLKDFGARFHNFIEAQSYYFLIRGRQASDSQPPAQAMFDFSGEYSVVAPDLLVIDRKSEVEADVHRVKDALAQAGGLDFSPTSWVSILGNPGGIVTRFACVHLVNVFLPIRVPPGHPPNPARPKSMQGELEIAVMPDDSHKYFPGQKTIVRFRLVG